jgi:hypothetical protein
MHAYAAAGAAFLLAVLWFDLMFDVQVMRHREETLPAGILASISAYYRRVLIDARPMGNLVAVVMLLTLAAIVAEIAQGEGPAWMSLASLACAAAAIGLAGARTVRNAAALGRQDGSAQSQSRLARMVFRDHVFDLVAMGAVLALQLAGA